MAYAIKKGSDYFNTVTYTGNGSTNAITGVGFSPDFVWVKNRAAGEHHCLYDSVRGIYKQIYSNLTNTEDNATNSLTSFDSDGFTLGNNTTPNTNSNAHVAWNWKGGESTVENTDGSITSQVSANPTAGFSVVTFTGTQTNQTVGHGLGVPPEIIITKNRDLGTNWVVGNTPRGWTKYLFFNLVDAEGTSGNPWNNTAPTSSVYTVGTASDTNGSSQSQVAYCFASVEGYSKIGSYTGNGSADGPFLYTGFRPKFLMFKTTTIIGHWVIVDAERNTYNVIDDSLYPDTTGSEINTITDVDFLSNGFKWRGVLSNETNVNGQVYIYMAFAETPFKFANAR